MRILAMFPVLSLVGCDLLDELVNAGESASGEVTLGDQQAQLVGLSVSTNTTEISVGKRLNITAEAQFSDGTLEDYTDLVSWTVNKSGIVSITDGEVLAVEEGTARIAASWGEVESERLKVVVIGDGGPANKPDLAITAVETWTYSGTLSYDVFVKNVGNGKSAATTVDIFVDQATAPLPGALSPYFGNVPPLAVGEEVMVEAGLGAVPFDQCAAGCTSWVIVDSELVVNETDESNNVRGPVQVDTSW
jgi:hypothetical protein